MDERSLLLLGMLMSQSLHGYQMNVFLEKNLGRITNMKKSTAYSLLDKLSAEGFVHMSSEQEGNRPPRKVYSITEEGRLKFKELLRDNLSQPDRVTFALDVGLMFVDHLEKQELREFLAERVSQLDKQIADHPSAQQHGHGIGVDLAMEHHRVILSAEREWLASVIERMK